MSYLIQFLTAEYLDGYIKTGGSKIKLVMDTDGTGVGRLLHALCEEATRCGYAAAYLDAAAVAKVHLLSNIYQAVVRELDLAALIKDYAARVVKALGYDGSEIPAGSNFVAWAAEKYGRVPELLRRAVQERLEKDIFYHPRVNQSFATVTLHLVADLLGAGYKNLTGEDKALLYAWLRGDEVSLQDLRRFHIFTRVDRYNARLMLRSLVELARLAGKAGLFLAVDRLEVLVAKRETGRFLYGRVAREEFFESVRQLIDGIDALSSIMVVLGFRRELADDVKRGLPSYEPLWLRIQHEIVGSRVNLFRDFLDLDEAAAAATWAGAAPG